MKNRNLTHKDDWATPPFLYDELNKCYNFDFDPCPFMHDVNKWDGLQIDWKNRNFINPPYNTFKSKGYTKQDFVYKAIAEMQKGKLCVMLLPVSTSTKLFHSYILPNITEPAKFLYKRIPFIGINSKGQYVNWHLWDKEAPANVEHVKNAGQHDSMVVVFDGR